MSVSQVLASEASRKSKQVAGQWLHTFIPTMHPFTPSDKIIQFNFIYKTPNHNKISEKR